MQNVVMLEPENKMNFIALLQRNLARYCILFACTKIDSLIHWLVKGEIAKVINTERESKR